MEGLPNLSKFEKTFLVNGQAAERIPSSRLRGIWPPPTRGQGCRGADPTGCDSGGTAIPGNFQVDGRPVTDQRDDDVGEFSGQTVRVRISRLPVDGTVRVRFETEVIDGRSLKISGTRGAGGELSQRRWRAR